MIPRTVAVSLRAVVLAVLLVATLAGCSKDKGGADVDAERAAALLGPVLRIGVLSPMTGDFAEDGQDIVNGVKTAVAQFAPGGKLTGFGPFTQVELQSEDTGCDPRQAALWARSMVEAKVNAVIGAYCSGATLEAAETLDRWGVPLLTPASTNMDVTGRGWPYVFRLCGNDLAQAVAAVRFMHERRAVRSLFLVDDGTEYSRNLADYVEVQAKDASIKIVGREAVDMGQQDYAAVLQKVKAAAPDMFYVSLQNADAGSRMISQARKAGVTAQIMSQDAVRHQRFIKSAWKAAEGVYFTFAKIDRDRPEYRNFAALYRKLGYGEPGSYSASAYDAALVLLTAIRKAGGAAPDAIRDQLLAMDVEGASKRILFRNNGDTEAAYVVQRVENGRFVDVWAP